MIHVNHPVFDLHDLPNALFLNNYTDYNCDSISVHFFIPVINTRCSKKHFHWLISNNKIYIFFRIKIFEHYLNI